MMQISNSWIISRLRLVYITLKTKGVRYTLARIFRKLYVKLENQLPAREVLPDIPSSSDIRSYKHEYHFYNNSTSNSIMVSASQL